MHKRFYIILSLLSALVVCFTQIAPGFLHRHHCYADNAHYFEKSKHIPAAVYQEKATENTVFSDWCPICAAHSASDLYFHHFSISVTPPEPTETAFFCRAFSDGIPLLVGSSRAPPFGLF